MWDSSAVAGRSKNKIQERWCIIVNLCGTVANTTQDLIQESGINRELPYVGYISNCLPQVLIHTVGANTDGC